MSNVPYILGHSDAKLRRLMLQAAMLKPITRRLLLEAGLQPGMRVFRRNGHVWSSCQVSRLFCLEGS